MAKNIEAKTRQRTALAALLGLVLAFVGAASAAGAGHVEIRTPFDAGQGQFPEGVAVDRQGNVFVGLLASGEVWKVPAGQTTPVLFGSVAGLIPGDFGGLAGLATDVLGNVYGAVVSSNDDARGVWKFDRRTAASERLPGTENIAFPNGITFDKRGNLYVTNTSEGSVWRVPPGGSAHEWIADAILEGDGSAGFPIDIGANGIAIARNVVYVGVTESLKLVRIPIRPDGSAGAATLHAMSPVPIDGIAIDVLDNIYVASPVAGSVVRVAPNGSATTLATNADGLDNPTSVAFGSGRGDARTLFAVSVSAGLGGPGGNGPSLAAIDVGVKGYPEP